MVIFHNYVPVNVYQRVHPHLILLWNMLGMVLSPVLRNISSYAASTQNGSSDVHLLRWSVHCGNSQIKACAEWVQRAG